MSSATAARDRATGCAASEPERSLALARQVGDPWFPCQALAWAARFSSDAESPKIAKEALAAAASDSDPYKAVGASAWPVRVAVERGLTDGIGRTLGGLLATAATIAHPVRRLDALFLLWQAVFPLGASGRRDVQDALVTACRDARSWRAGRTLRDVALMLAADDPAEAARVVGVLPERRHRRQVARRLAAGERHSPRPFFWRDGQLGSAREPRLSFRCVP